MKEGVYKVDCLNFRKNSPVKSVLLLQIKYADHQDRSAPTCANLREAWAKRRYPAHFVSKLTDCDGENSETDTWLDFA